MGLAYGDAKKGPPPLRTPTTGVVTNCFGWEKLRNESPGVDESYADLVPIHQCTQVKIHVARSHGQLFVN
jgi:hypothetical protein